MIELLVFHCMRFQNFWHIINEMWILWQILVAAVYVSWTVLCIKYHMGYFEHFEHDVLKV